MPDIRPLSKALAAKARDELSEKPESIAANIETIRGWLEIQPHLKSHMDDQFLVSVLRGCKYSLERTKEKLDIFYTVRTATPEFFANRDPHLETNLNIIRLGFILPLPMTNGSDGPRLILYRLGVYDPHKISFEDVMRCATMIYDILLMEDDQMIVAGQLGVMDFSNTTLTHYLQFHPAMLKKVVMVTQEGSSLRVKGYHYIHTPPAFNAVFTIFKGLLNEKMRNRLFMHGENMESLFKEVPKKLLPLEYGGDADSIPNLIDKWEKKIIAYSEYFKNEEQYGCDETKRIGASKSKGLFGVEGSFRKLTID